MFKATLVVLGIFALATPALAEECADGSISKVLGKGADGQDVSFCVRKQDEEALDKWIDRCEQQSAVRVKRGAKADDVKVIFSFDGKQPHCHIDASRATESGAIDE